MAKSETKKSESAPVQETAFVAPIAPKSIVELQNRTMAAPNPQEEIFPSRLVVNNGNEMVIYHVDLPQSVLVALLDPTVGDGFIRIKPSSTSIQMPGGGKIRFLHTSQIREVLFDKELPDGLLGGE